jgi:hypothetical protein
MWNKKFKPYGTVKLETFGHFLRVHSHSRKINCGIIMSLRVSASSKYAINFTGYKQCITKVRFVVYNENMKELDLIDYPEINRAKTNLTYILSSEIDRQFYFGIIFDNAKIDDAFVIEDYSLNEIKLIGETEKMNALLKITEKYRIMEVEQPNDHIISHDPSSLMFDKDKGSKNKEVDTPTLTNEYIPSKDEITSILKSFYQIKMSHAIDTISCSMNSVVSNKYKPIYKTRLDIIMETGLHTIVELGCNDGLCASEICRANYYIKSYKGYDINPTAVFLARHRFSSSPAAKIFQFAIGDIDKHFRKTINETPTIYLAFQIFEHMENDLEFLQLIAPGSIVLFSLPNYECHMACRVALTDHDIIQRYGHLFKTLKINWHYMEGSPVFECVGTR